MSKPRQVPPPCWTQDECHALVLAFRDRYYALGRTTLKAADWEQVAAATAKACPPSLSAPPKTALQCRNKMDKLRMRYRSKKNRAASSPSTWALFSLFDEMDPDPVPRHLVSSNLLHNNLGNVGRNFEFQNQVSHNSMPQFNFNSNLGGNSGFCYEDDDLVDDVSALPLTTLDGRYPLPPGFRPKSHMSVSKHNFKQRGHYGIDYEEGVFIPKTRSDKGFGPAGFGPGSSGRIDGNFTSNGYCDEFDEASRSRSKFVNKNGGVGIERDLGSVGDLASSLRMLGERFVRVEELKMEMAMEIEKKRMEMELKRDKVIIESQQQMVDMLLNALLPKKKKKKANVDSPDS